tara:strand:+ start:756 stop:1265 length:510 start_codon:yes stop_codon:yes gene_type:complete
MVNKYLFKKNKNKNKKYIYIFSILLFILIIYIYFPNIKNEYFLVEKNNIKFFEISKKKSGKIIPNSDIRILDYDNDSVQEIDNINSLLFSIQLYASSNYNEIVKKLYYLEDNYSFYKKDLFVVALKHNLGIDYLIVYKNFINKIEAMDHCRKHLNFVENCLIVNIQNLE